MAARSFTIRFDQIIDDETRWLARFCAWLEAAVEDSWRRDDEANALVLVALATACLNEVSRRLLPTAIEQSPRVYLAVSLAAEGVRAVVEIVKWRVSERIEPSKKGEPPAEAEPEPAPKNRRRRLRDRDQ